MYNSALDILGQLFIRFTLTLLTSFETLDIYIYTQNYKLHVQSILSHRLIATCQLTSVCFTTSVLSVFVT